MKRKLCIPALCIFSLSLFFLINSRQCYGFDITIEIAPNVLNLGNQGQVVTVHTDIDYGMVYASSVTLNGILISWWKEDNRGNFVAKFFIDNVKNIVTVGTNTLRLEGITVNGVTFAGEETIEVVNNIPTGGN